MLRTGLAVLLVAFVAPAAQAATPPPAMASLDFMDGVWKGEAKGYSRSGPYTVTQTERVGPMLEGGILVIEGRGYEADGGLAYNAFGVISYDPDASAYEFRAYNDGRAVTAPMTVDGKVVTWEMPAGPDAITRFTLDFTSGAWHETGEYIVGGQARPILDMTLTRTGDNDWPAAGAVVP